MNGIDPGENLSQKEAKELKRLLEKRGCSSCGATNIGAHFCPGPKRKPLSWSHKENWSKR